MRAALVTVLCLELGRAGPAAPDPIVASAYDHFYNLEYDQALAGFTSQAQQQPDSMGAWNHIAQCILYRAMYQDGALESGLVSGGNSIFRRSKVKISPEDEARFQDAVDRATQLAQAKLKENPKDKEALYALGVAYGIRANFAFLLSKTWLEALRNATIARKTHNKIAEMDPSFVDARLIQGVHDYVIGSLPLTYRVLGFLAGFRGDRQAGIRALEDVAKNGIRSDIDAEVLLIAIYRREKRSQEAIPLLVVLIRRFPRNHLFRFEMVQMYEDTGNKEQAMAQISEIARLKESGAPGFKDLRNEKIDYVAGNALFQCNDLDGALARMKRVTGRAHDLDANTNLMAWMRLGQIYDLRGEHAQAVAAYKEAIASAPQSEIAKQSRAYISNPYRRKT
jgi:tetratricopeptide (TPR) repeat protein